MFAKLARSLCLVMLSGGLLVGCSASDDGVSVDPGTWNIPENLIFFGGVSKDGIPSLNNPKVIPAVQADFIREPDLVVGLVVDGQARAYPHAILDWHEVVNQSIGGNRFTLSYCPLTGTAIAFDGRNAGRELTFGVSGLLYNNNLIMFDRQTDSHWPQMRLQCDQGELRNTKQKVIPVIETSWASWKKLYPNTVVLSTETGFDRPYHIAGAAYPGYTGLDSGFLFPVAFRDNRLPNKQRVHGVLGAGDADNYTSKVYLIDLDQPSRVINDVVGGQPIVVVDSGKDNFVVSYSRNAAGQTLTFELPGEPKTFPFTFRDRETGSIWNVLGEAVDGPLSGTRLEATRSFNAYWFAWAVFYPGAEIYTEN